MKRKVNDFSKEELEVLNNVASLIVSPKDLTEVLNKVLEVLSKKMGMNRGMISIYRRDLKEIVVDVSHGFKASDAEITYQLGEGITGRVVETGRPVAISNLENEPLFLDRSKSRKKLNRSEMSFMCVPIKYDQEVVGALSVDRVNRNGEDLVTEIKFLEDVCHYLAHRVRSRRLLDENTGLKKILHLSMMGGDMIGNCEAIRQVNYLISQVAASDTSVLITGSTGTGKGIAASLLHKSSFRRNKNLIVVNCGAIPESLVESELFGHERGAFTGADKMRPGKFELANEGTIFLDEIGELPFATQTKLLRIIQDKEMERVGGIKTIKVDVRVVAATNRNLEEDVANGLFREDLFYRLNVFPIHMPQLRERGSDVLLLTDHFILKYAKQLKRNVTRIDTPAIDLLMSYHWPGNVRELENAVERAILLAENGVIQVQHLPPSLQVMNTDTRRPTGKLDALVGAYEKSLIIQSLKESRGNQAKAASNLGCSGRVMHYKVNKYRIDVKRFGEK